MKELVALVAVVLCVLVAYQMHRERLAAAKKPEAPATEIAKWPLSEYLDPYRKELASKFDERRPVDLVPPLQALRKKVLAKRQTQDVSIRPISDAGIVVLDQMIVAAEHRTRALQELLQIGARPTSSLERQDSGNTASAFFKGGALQRAESGQAQRQGAVEQALAQLLRAEAAVASAFGPEAVQEDYGSRRLQAHYLQTDKGSGADNPLQQGAYDYRRAIVPREDRTTQTGF